MSLTLHAAPDTVRPTHIRVHGGRISGSRTTISQVYAVEWWDDNCGDLPCAWIYNDVGDLEKTWPCEYEPANPPAPVAADTVRPRNPHATLDYNSRDAFAACMAVVSAFDDVSDETLTMVIAEPRNDRPQMWVALQAARAALSTEGYRA